MPRGYEADLIALSSRQKGHHALVLGDALVQDDVNVGTAADVSSDMSTTDRGVDMTPPLVTTTGPIGTELTFNGVAKPQEEGVEPWNPARATRPRLEHTCLPKQTQESFAGGPCSTPTPSMARPGGICPQQPREPDATPRERRASDRRRRSSARSTHRGVKRYDQLAQLRGFEQQCRQTPAKASNFRPLQEVRCWSRWSCCAQMPTRCSGSTVPTCMAYSKSIRMSK